jgi:hypothetical protein
MIIKIISTTHTVQSGDFRFIILTFCAVFKFELLSWLRYFTAQQTASENLCIREETVGLLP